MAIFLFFSERDTGIFGLTDRPDGGILPASLAPWARFGDGEPLHPDLQWFGPGSGVRSSVIAAIEHDGFYVGRTSQSDDRPEPAYIGRGRNDAEAGAGAID